MPQKLGKLFFARPSIGHPLGRSVAQFRGIPALADDSLGGVGDYPFNVMWGSTEHVVTYPHRPFASARRYSSTKRGAQSDFTRRTIGRTRLAERCLIIVNVRCTAGSFIFTVVPDADIAHLQHGDLFRAKCKLIRTNKDAGFLKQLISYRPRVTAYQTAHLVDVLDNAGFLFDVEENFACSDTRIFVKLR